MILNYIDNNSKPISLTLVSSSCDYNRDHINVEFVLPTSILGQIDLKTYLTNESIKYFENDQFEDYFKL